MRKYILEQLEPVFKPKTIAVIGASNNPRTWGNEMMLNPLSSGFRGAIYPVNPQAKKVLGLPAYPSVLKVPVNIDLAVIVVPAPIVPTVMKECVEKGVKGAVIISAGFAETGEAGAVLQEKVLNIARKGDIRIVGPNCMGIWSAPVRLNLAFGKAPRPGPISFISQSGTFGAYLFEAASGKGYGFNYFVSSGNEADLTSVDYLEYFGKDPDTKAIVVYMEGVRDGRKFVDVAREVVSKKPIIIYKAGQTPEGSRAALSHTASITGRDEVFDAVCKHVGILRVYESFHAFDIAEALSRQLLPKCNRIAIIGSGGFSVISAETAAKLRLEIPEFDEETKANLMKILPSHAPVPRNPVDTAGDDTLLMYAKIADMVASLDYIDGILMSFWGGNLNTLEEMEETLRATKILASLPEKYGKPVFMTSLRSSMQGPIYDILKESDVLFFESPEECVRAMHGMVEYVRILKKI
jgi:acyl-CoA synthetase (NDP forming)